MPVDSVLLATSDDDVSDGFVESLNEDLIDQMGGDCFSCAGDIRAVSRSTNYPYYNKPDNLPDASITIVCHPATPFYGPNYERGYWPNLAALIEVLRRRVPNSTVWFGPDSSDLVERVTHEWFDNMWEYWARNGSRPYDSQFKEFRRT